MNKELTPLEALKELKRRYGKYFSLNDDERSKIIETALKDYEELQKDYCEVVEKRGEWQEKNNKKLKTLEIIKEKLDANTICRVFGFKGYDIIKYFTDNDLLREWLK